MTGAGPGIEPGHLIAHRYRVVRLLGEGAMGAVWLVEDTTSGDRVALKVIKLGATPLEKSVLQFKQEFRLMTQLRHPNCCAVYDYGVLEDGSPYFTMEHVPGRDLGDATELPARVQDLVAQLALALGYVHQLGLVHRDLKAANVRVRPDGVVKLMDYGLMDYAGRPGAVAGTLGYMAPEVIQRAPVDARADLYALGCLAYALLDGDVPFVGERAAEVLRAHLNDRPRPLRGVPSDLARLVYGLLEKDPERRPQSAGAVLEALGVAAPPGIGGSLLAPPLIERDAVTARLEAALADVGEHRRGGLLLLHGDPGLGKSRLAQGIRHRAQLGGLVFAMGRGAEGRAMPYAPFVHVLRELMPTLLEALPWEVARHAPVLATLLPELRAPDDPTPGGADGDKTRLQAAIAALLLGLAAERPVVLVLEDWHWIDPLSVEMLAGLRRADPAQRLLIVLTSRRPEEPGVEWVAKLESITLAPLTREGTGRMVGAMLGVPPGGAAGGEPEPAVVDAVMAATAGNPFFIETYMEHLVHMRELVREDGRWVARLTAAGDAPRNLEVFLRDQLAGLPEGALTLARIGALLGRTFDLDLLQDVASYDEAELFESLRGLRAAHVLAHVEAGLYRFAHERYRETLYADLPPDERTMLHALVLGALERRPVEGLDWLTAVANHAIGAGDARAIARWAPQAGRRLLDLYAVDEARRYFEAGLEAARRTDDDRAALACLEALADILRIGGRMPPALALYDEAIALAAELGAPGRANLLVSRAKVLLMKGDVGPAVAACAEAAALAEAAGQTAVLARCRMTQARALFYQGDMAGSLAQAAAAGAAARQAGLMAVEGDAMALEGFVRTQLGGEGAEDGIPLITRGVALMEEAGDKVNLNLGLNVLSNALLEGGWPLEAEPVLARYEALTLETGRTDEWHVARSTLATAWLDRGRFADAAATVEQPDADLAATAPQAVRIAKRALEAHARAALGQLDTAVMLADQSFAEAVASKSRYLEAFGLPHCVEAWLAAGRVDKAAAALGHHDAGGAGGASALDLARAEVKLAEGDVPAAEGAAARVLAFARDRRMALLEARALALRGRLRLAARDLAGAGADLADARAIAEARGAAALAVELEAAQAAHALATGDDPAARYEALLPRAEAVGAPMLTALAAFGLAGAVPAGSRQDALLARAQAIVADLAERMDDPAPFLARSAIRAIHTGALVRPTRRETPAPRPFGMGPGFGQF